MNDSRDQAYDAPSPFASLDKFVAGIACTLLLLGIIVYLCTNWKAVVTYSWVAMLVLGLLVVLFLVIACLYIREDLHDRHQRRDLEHTRLTHELKMQATRLYADERGNRPFLYDEVSSQVIEVASGNYIEPVPHTYSPRIDYRPAQLAPVEEETKAKAQPLQVPTFAALLDAGMIGPGKPFMIGYDYESGNPHHGSWLDLYSCAIAGLQGSGKTTTELWIILQSVLHQAQLLIIDPHRDTAQDSLGGRLLPLSEQFLLPIAGDDNHAILSVIKRARQEVARRRQGLTGAATILIVDEFTKLMRRSPEIHKDLAACIEEIAQEGRKMGVFALLSGQIWKAAAAGGTELRYSLASSFVHRIQEAQAKLLISSEHAKQAPALKPGQAFFYDTNGETHLLQIPLTTEQDVLTVARRLQPAFVGPSSRLQETPTEMASIPSLKFVPKPHEAAHELSGPLLPPELETKYADVVALMAQEKKQGEIIATVWGVPSGGGAAYQKAADELRIIQRVIAQQVRRED